MGATIRTIDDDKHLRRTFDWFQLVNLIENILEFIMLISLFIARYLEVVVFVFAVCAAVPTVVRSIRLIFTLSIQLGVSDVECCKFCWEDNERPGVNNMR